MKKAISIILAFLLAVGSLSSLAACYPDGGKTNESESSKVESTPESTPELRYPPAIWRSYSDKAMKKLR